MTGVIRGKIWGFTTELLRSPMFEMHQLRIKPWHRCSYHEHSFKHNAFFVLDGILYLDIAGDTNQQEKKSIKLTQGEVHTIPPGIQHQFRTGRDECSALEMYFIEPLSEDIIRSNVGGPV